MQRLQVWLRREEHVLPGEPVGEGEPTAGSTFHIASRERDYGGECRDIP